MKKFVCAMLLVAALAVPSFAKTTADEYRNKDYDFSSIKTVLILPVMYDVKIPDTEAFFDEKVSQKWKALTDPSKTKFTFLAKTPEEIVKRDNFVKSLPEGERLSPLKAAERALTVADQYVDVILRAAVTECRIETVRHPEEITWETRWEDKDVWVYDHWETRRVERRYQRVKPAWDERISVGGAKVEMRDAKDNTLIYGVVVNARTGPGFFENDSPNLTLHTCNILENAAKRIPAK